MIILRILLPGNCLDALLQIHLKLLRAVQQIGAGICDCQVNGLEITFYCLILGTVIHDWTEK